ncbi:zinc-ribbon domain-containing protein [Candidatus Lokiarchaeum ossiferum]|uniref:zinc-ribbon domain-containing protein n=1 Tax=Candidatus Lokiarchaeum ossiferum TaxID=2951803 RepID=UPI00352D52C9
MPRGGGGFSGGGGGFRGGGFRSSGGSFRSSSFRSSSPSFRSRSSSRPYGRTGARRTTSSSYNRRRSSPYHHHSYHRPYYRRRHYHRPYYYRSWWYRPYFWGRHYRPWYYSPVYVGGGLVLAVVLMMVFIPLMGIALSFPFSSSSSSGLVNYRATEQLNFNEYWYEYETLEAGNEIKFDIQATTPISFAIADHPFADFPTTTETGQDTGHLTLGADEYGYQGYYVSAGSNLVYNYSATDGIEFKVMNSDEFNSWLYYGIPDTFDESMASAYSSNSAFFGSEDVYLVWYNEVGPAVDVDYTINYTITEVYDLTGAEFSEIATQNVDGTITVPEDGTWYFFVFFDPMYSNAESTSITFDVTYDKQLDTQTQWANIRPTLIWVAIISVALILIARSARKKQKAKGITANGTSVTQTGSTKSKVASSTLRTTNNSKSSVYGKSEQKQTLSASVKTTLQPQIDPSKCTRCGCSLEAKDIFCPACGKKKEGRKVGGTTVSKELKSQVCSYCGKQIQKDAQFCIGCGSKIQR